MPAFLGENPDPMSFSRGGSRTPWSGNSGVSEVGGEIVGVGLRVRCSRPITFSVADNDVVCVPGRFLSLDWRHETIVIEQYLGASFPPHMREVLNHIYP